MTTADSLDTLESLRAEVESLQQQLQATQHGFKAVFDHTPYCMTIIDLLNDGSLRHIRSNAATLRMFGVQDQTNPDPQFSEETRAKTYANFVACRELRTTVRHR